MFRFHVSLNLILRYSSQLPDTAGEVTNAYNICMFPGHQIMRTQNKEYKPQSTSVWFRRTLVCISQHRDSNAGVESQYELKQTSAAHKAGFIQTTPCFFNIKHVAFPFRCVAGTWMQTSQTIFIYQIDTHDFKNKTQHASEQPE